MNTVRPISVLILVRYRFCAHRPTGCPPCAPNDLKLFGNEFIFSNVDDQPTQANKSSDTRVMKAAAFVDRNEQDSCLDDVMAEMNRRPDDEGGVSAISTDMSNSYYP